MPAIDQRNNVQPCGRKTIVGIAFLVNNAEDGPSRFLAVAGLKGCATRCHTTMTGLLTLSEANKALEIMASLINNVLDPVAHIDIVNVGSMHHEVNCYILKRNNSSDRLSNYQP